MNRGTARGAAFLVVGALGFVVQIASLAALTSLARWHWSAATIVSVELAVVHNFMWHERWTWRDRAGAGGTIARFVKFQAGNGLTSVAGNAALMAALAGVLGLPPVQANILAVGVLAAVNFAIADRLVFTRGSRSRPRAPAPPNESDVLPRARAESTRQRFSA